MLDFIERHQVLMSVVIYPLLTALLTAVAKPRTPEEYSALPPRLAAFLKLVGALGLDVPNAIEAIKQGINGRSQSAGVYRAVRSETTPPKRYVDPQEAPTRPELDTPTPTPTTVRERPSQEPKK